MDTTAHGENGAGSRRRFLQAVGLGGALSALPLVARAAGAQSGSTTTAGAATSAAAAVTTTTAPPKRPTEADIELLSFLQTAEVSAFLAYRSAVDRDELSLPDDVRPVLEVFAEHHQAYAQSISGLLGRDAPNAPNAAVLEQFGAPFESGALEEVFAGAQALEDALVATHLNALGELAGTDGSALIASILAIEARHSTVLSALGGTVELMPTSGVETIEAALAPDDFPVE